MKYKLTEIGSLSRGKSKHRPRNDKSLYDGKYPFVQTSDIKNANHILRTYQQTYNEKGLKQSKLWHKNTICITIAANIAESAILGFDACFPDSVLGLVVDDKIADFHYIEYLLQHYKRTIQNQANGTSQENINLETFEKVYFDIPILKEQQKIGRILSNIDEKIAVNNEINKLLEQSARAIYEYYFVQFDFPNANGKPYKSSGGEMIFNPTLNHHIPKTFEVKVMKDFLSVVTGKEDANFATKNGQYAFFTCGDEILRCDKSVFKGKAILIAGNGNFNVKYFDGEFNAYQRTYVLIPKNELYAGILYFSALNRIDIFTKGSNGSIVKFITKGDIENIPVILPNDTQILSVFNTILDKQNLIRIENQKLKALRDFLLPLLLNAQVKIK